MSKAKKIWIGIGIVGALCICAGIVTFLVLRETGKRMTSSFKTDPAEVAALADKIAAFEVPPGYELQMGMSFLNYDTVSIAPTSKASSRMTIMLMQFTSLMSTDPAVREKQMQQAIQQQNASNIAMKVVKQYTATIRGEETTVTVSESSSSQGGITLRQLMTIFTGNKGPTILMIQGSTNDWDEDLIKNFIESIK